MKMRFERTDYLTDDQKATIARFWNNEYPRELQFDDVAGFERFLDGVTDKRHFLVFNEAENLIGWLVAFTRDGERWFSIIVDSAAQQSGVGTRLIAELQEHEPDVNGWVVARDDYFKSSGAPYRSPLGFYRRLGFTVVPGVKLEKNGLEGVKINWKRHELTETRG